MATPSRCLSCLVRARISLLRAPPSARRKPTRCYPIRPISSTSSPRKKQGLDNKPLERDVEPNAKTDAEAEGQIATEEQEKRDKLTEEEIKEFMAGPGDIFAHDYEGDGPLPGGQLWDGPFTAAERKELRNGELGDPFFPLGDETEAERSVDTREPPYRPGFLAVYETQDDPGPDPEFEYDDITSTAHSHLEQLREMREFARCIAWDMPLLHQYAKPFEPPKESQPLRFRYTTYMGEEHPASRKVVVSFSPQKLDPSLTPVQVDKLIKLLGVRYNPSTQQAKISCELHATPAQNKRHLGDQVDKLIDEVKNGEDTFEDLPFDFRHHKPKKVHVFPEEWKMTPERMERLEQRRTQRLQQEELKVAHRQLVQGKLIIAGVAENTNSMEADPVMATIGASQAAQRRQPSRPRTVLR